MYKINNIRMSILTAHNLVHIFTQQKREIFVKCRRSVLYSTQKLIFFDIQNKITIPFKK